MSVYRLVSKNQSYIKSVVVRLSTDKPVRKTSYQVKGVLMKEFPDNPIIPFINGSYRNNYLYPRVQVKILNEQIYLIGIKEGVEPIESIAEKLDIMNFGNITFKVEDVVTEIRDDGLGSTDKTIQYKFLTSWIALNQINLKRYKALTDKDRLILLRRLLSQNIAFVGKEVGLALEERIFVDLNLESLQANLMDEGKMGCFNGEFRTNFILPNFIGLGNGITKGYGVLFSQFNSADFSSEETELTNSQSDNQEAVGELPEGWEDEAIDPNDIPRSKRLKNTKKEQEVNDPNFNTTKYHSKTH